MNSHITVLGIFLLVFGILGLLSTLFVMLICIGVPGVAMSLSDVNDADAAIAMTTIAVVMMAVVCLIAVTSIPSLIAGYGLVSRKSWSWIWGLVACVLELLSIPFGTAVGIYGLWVLLQNETQEILKRESE